MDDPARDPLADELKPIVSRLRAERAELDPLQLDELKRRVLDRMRGQRHLGGLVKSRLITMLTLVALTGGTGGALALAGGGSSGSSQASAAKSQYRPGKGCGDRKHKHKGSKGKPVPCPQPKHKYHGKAPTHKPTPPKHNNGAAHPHTPGTVHHGTTLTGATSTAGAPGLPGAPTTTLGPPTLIQHVRFNNVTAANSCNGKTVTLSGAASVMLWYTRNPNGGYSGFLQVVFGQVRGSDPTGASYHFASSTIAPFTTNGSSTLAQPVHVNGTSTGSSPNVTFSTLLHETFASNGTPTASLDNNALSCTS